MQRSRQRGLSLVLATLVLACAAGAFLFLQVGLAMASAQRDRVNERALAQAREALVSYAADRAITPVVGPGYLPCPDLDDDGWAESTCGSLAGDRGQSERLGRLPWKTLGLPDLRDSAGERLWYAVSTRYKGLLNCAASANCVDMSPTNALGTITVRDSSGRVTHDGTRAHARDGGAVAVVLAPGAPLHRAGREQTRECAPDDCDAAGRCIVEPPARAARCDPRNYLDAAPAERSGEDNADFHDRSDAGRARNGNGFIHGPVLAASGDLAVNDRLAVIAYSDVMPRVMKRVALEVAHCLSFYASRPENRGRFPPPEAACPAQAPTPPFGRIPDTPFTGAAAHRMLDRWWRASPRDPEELAELPTQLQACRIAMAPLDDAPLRRLPPGQPLHEGSTSGVGEHSWWTHWKPHVFYAPAAALRPAAGSGSCDAGGACLDWLDARGRTLATGRRAALVVTDRPRECNTPLLDCDAASCRAVRDTPSTIRHETVLALP